MGTSRAGWASIDSTPPRGLPMGGRGPRFTPGARVLDSLAAQCVVLEEAKGGRTLWLSIDMIGMAWPQTAGFRQELSALTGIPFESIVINFSHTHSGPMSGFEGYATLKQKPADLQAYEDDLIQRCLKMAVDAIEGLQAVTVNVCRGDCEIGINRRLRKDGEMTMGPNPGGYLNRDLWVLDLKTDSSEDRCVLFNYGCHPVMVYGFAWDGISPDWPGVCRNQLVDRLGPRTHAQFIQGFAGNVRPRQLADLELQTFRKSTPEDVLATGGQIADDIVSALASGESIDLDISCAAGFAMAPRNRGELPDLAHWESLAASDEELDQNLGAYWRDRIASGVPPVRYLPWAVGLIRLAEGHQIAWMANEVLGEWLPLLREWLDDPHLIGWGYCQDGRNYMPTDELLNQGGYEVERANLFSKNGPGQVAPGIDGAVREVYLDMAGRIS